MTRRKQRQPSNKPDPVAENLEPEAVLRSRGATRLERGEVNPLETEGLSEDDLRLFYDQDGNLKYMGGIDDDFRIQHDVEHIVMDVDSVDLEFLEEALSNKLIKDWLKQLEKRSRFFKEAFENFFLMLVKNNPTLNPHVGPRQFYLMRLLTEVVEFEDFQELSKKCTLHVTRSALVAKTWVEAIEKILDAEDLKFIEEMEWLQEEFSDVFSDVERMLKHSACGQPVPGELGPDGKPVQCQDGGEQGEPCPGCGQHHQKLRPKTAKELGLSAEQARERMRKIAEQVGELRQRIREKIEKHKDRIEAVSKHFAEKAVADGAKASDSIDNLAKSFGVQPGELKSIDMTDIIATADRYRSDKLIKNVVDQLGRMRKIAKKSMKSMTREVENMKNLPMELGADPAKMMPNEMVNFRHPRKKRDFKKRLLEREIEQFDTKGREHVGRGPIIVCKDTSGSMDGAPNHWASAMYLAVESVAAQQRRDSVLINFSSPGQLKVSEFDKKAGFIKYIEEASFMFNGGTCFETPLKKALEFIEMSKYKKADVLFISDGVCTVSEKFLENFNKVKREKEFRVVTILVNLGGFDVSAVNSFSDKVLLVSDLQKDQDVLETAFAI